MDEFFEAWRYVPFLLVGALLNGLSLFEGCIYAAARRTREVSLTTFVGAIANIGLCVVLTFAVGPMGAAVATMLGYLVTWAVRTAIMVKGIARIRVPWAVELASLAILVCQAVLASQWGMHPAQLVATAALAVIQRKRLKGVVSALMNRVKRTRSR